MINLRITPDSNSDPNHDDLEDPPLDVEPEVSIAAITGIPRPDSLKVKGILKKSAFIVLIDSGATLNFIDIGIAYQLGLYVAPKIGFNVSIPGHQILHCFDKIKNFVSNLVITP